MEAWSRVGGGESKGGEEQKREGEDRDNLGKRGREEVEGKGD